MTCISSTAQHWLCKQSPQVFVGLFGLAWSLLFSVTLVALWAQQYNHFWSSVTKLRYELHQLLNEWLFCLRTLWKIGNVAFAAYHVLSCCMVKRLSVEASMSSCSIYSANVLSCLQSVIGNWKCWLSVCWEMLRTACGTWPPWTACGTWPPWTACGTWPPWSACGTWPPWSACGTWPPWCLQFVASGCSIASHVTSCSMLLCQQCFSSLRVL